MRDDIKTNIEDKALFEKILKALSEVFDPEIDLDIINLGLVYEINLDDQGHLDLIMTLTSTACSCADDILTESRKAMSDLDEVSSVDVNVVWNPAWNPAMITRFGRISLGINPN